MFLKYVNSGEWGYLGQNSKREIQNKLEFRFLNFVVGILHFPLL